MNTSNFSGGEETVFSTGEMQTRLDRVEGRLSRVEAALGLASGVPSGPLPVTTGGGQPDGGESPAQLQEALAGPGEPSAAPVCAPSWSEPAPAAAPLTMPAAVLPVLELERARERGRAAQQEAAERAGATGANSQPHNPVTAAHTPKWREDTEVLIGGRWALWAGSFSLFVALALCLSWSWKYIPMEARVALVYIAGALLLGLAEKSRPHAQQWFPAGFAGSGIALWYLTTWAAGIPRTGIMAPITMLVLQLGITAIAMVMALRLNHLSVATIALLGGFTSLLMTMTGPVPAYSQWTYVALLNTGLLGICALRNWPTLRRLTFAATLFSGTALHFSTSLPNVWEFLFVTYIFQAFFLASIAYGVLWKRPHMEVDIALLFAASAVYIPVGQYLLTAHLGHFQGVFLLAVALSFAASFLAVLTRTPAHTRLRDSLAALALICLTAAVPFQFAAGSLHIVWAAQCVVMLALGLHLKSRLLVRFGHALLSLLLALMPFCPLSAHAPCAAELLLAPKSGWALPGSLPGTTAISWIILAAGMFFLCGKGLGDARLPAPGAAASLLPASSYQHTRSQYYAAATVLFGALALLTIRPDQFVAAVCGQGEEVLQSVLTVRWSLLAVALWWLGTKTRWEAVRCPAAHLLAWAALMPLLHFSRPGIGQFQPLVHCTLAVIGIIAAFTCWQWLAAQRQAVLTDWEKWCRENGGGLTLVYLALAVPALLLGALPAALTPPSSVWTAIALGWWALGAGAVHLGLHQNTAFTRSTGYWLMALAATLTCPLFMTTTGFGNGGSLFPRVMLQGIGSSVCVTCAHLVRGKAHAISLWEYRTATCFYGASAALLLLGTCAMTEAWRALSWLQTPEHTLSRFFLCQLLANALAYWLWHMGRREHFDGQSGTLLRNFAYTLWAFLVPLAVSTYWITPGHWLPWLNWRFGLQCALGITLFRVANRIAAETAPPLDGWHSAEKGLAPALTLGAISLGAVALMQDSALMGGHLQAKWGTQGAPWAAAGASLLLCAYSLALLIAGTAGKRRQLRLSGLGLLTLTLGKVFLLDIGMQGTVEKTVALGGLGATLLFVSWLYGRLDEGDTAASGSMAAEMPGSPMGQGEP